MAKEIFVVTHGEKEKGADPHMTTKGFRQVSKLFSLIPENPTSVACGTGRRHLDVAQALGLEPDRYTNIAGGPDSLEIDSQGNKFAVLANGDYIPLEMCTITEDDAPAIIPFLNSLPHDSVVCAGRVIMISAGVPDAESAAVYKLTIEDGALPPEIEKL